MGPFFRLEMKRNCEVLDKSRSFKHTKSVPNVQVCVYWNIHEYIINQDIIKREDDLHKHFLPKLATCSCCVTSPFQGSGYHVITTCIHTIILFSFVVRNLLIQTNIEL